MVEAACRLQQGFASKKKLSTPTQLHVANACLICPSNYCACLDDTDIFRTEMLLIASLIQEAISQHSHSCLATAIAADIPAVCSYGTLLMDFNVCSRAKLRPVASAALPWSVMCPSSSGTCSPIRYLLDYQSQQIPIPKFWSLFQDPGPHPKALFPIPYPWSPSRNFDCQTKALLTTSKPCFPSHIPGPHTLDCHPKLWSPYQSSTSHLIFLIPILKPWFPTQSPDPHSTLPVPTLDLWSLSLSLHTQD